MNIKQIKEKYTCLDYLGDRVVRKTTDGYLARCPWREDNHPSLTVTQNGKGWYDHTTGKHGNLIDMLKLCLNTDDLSRVCAEFNTTTLSLFNQSKILGEGKREKRSGFASFITVTLQSRALFAYLAERHINITIAKQFLREAVYSFSEEETGKRLFALAYSNDKGGYELRNKLFKGAKAPKGITTHFDRGNAPTVVFEGFFDMLSFATLCGGVKHNYIVLNSIVNADAAVEVLRQRGGAIYLCLDNDDAGTITTQRMMELLPLAIDVRQRFSPAKDVNEYLVSHGLTRTRVDDKALQENVSEEPQEEDEIDEEQTVRRGGFRR